MKRLEPRCLLRSRTAYHAVTNTADGVNTTADGVNTTADGVNVTPPLMVLTPPLSRGLRLFEGQGRKNKKGSFCTTWGPTSVQKALAEYISI